jgi:hypothetical protein
LEDHRTSCRGPCRIGLAHIQFVEAIRGAWWYIAQRNGHHASIFFNTGSTLPHARRRGCRRRTPGTRWSRRTPRRVSLPRDAAEPDRAARRAAGGVYPLRLRVPVPSLNQIRAGFAEACTIGVGGRLFTPAVRGTELVAESKLDGAENVVILHTPEPVSPRTERDAPDDRLMRSTRTAAARLPAHAGGTRPAVVGDASRRDGTSRLLVP